MARTPRTPHKAIESLEIEMACLVCVLLLQLDSIADVTRQLGLERTRTRDALYKLVDKGYLSRTPAISEQGRISWRFKVALGYRREISLVAMDKRNPDNPVDRTRDDALQRMVEKMRADRRNREPLEGEDDEGWTNTVLNLPHFKADGTITPLWDRLHRLLGMDVEEPPSQPPGP